MSNYPDALDTDENLYLVHDSLRMRLAEDYNPGDSFIVVEGDADVMAKFPATGLITLTEQCSDIEDRAVSFFYTSRTTTTFDGLTLIPTMEDVPKPKRITNVTQNVMESHHNAIKDAAIAIEEFIGVKGTIDTRPLGDTLTGRINFLTKLILTPRAWFKVDRRIGLIPLTVTFTDESIRTGNCEITYIWDFGDQTCTSVISGVSGISGISGISGVSATPGECPSVICVTSVVPIGKTNVIAQDLDGGSIQKTYTQPGIYSASLRVVNEYGEDTVLFTNLIEARIQAPDEAAVNIIPRSGQVLTPGTPLGGPFTTPPKIKARTNQLIDLEIQSGENPNTPGVSYAGELLDGSGNAIDPISSYGWNIADDLDHSNQPDTRVSFGVGGLFDMVLRVDTGFGSYRITTYEDSFDIIENQNLWLWTYNSGTTVNANEFGLISESFKVANTPLTISRSDSFLNGTANEEQAKREFSRNVGFTKRSVTPSGELGTSMMYWASGGPVIADQSVLVREFNGFEDTYITHPNIANRPWNWLFLNSDRDSYFVFGQEPPPIAPNTNPSYQIKATQSLSTLAVSTEEFTSASYLNGAIELTEHVSAFDPSGDPLNGYFAVYRGTWRDVNGYFTRNDGVGSFFRLRSFYQTQGQLTNLFTSITKLSDLAGTTKTEGELTTLSTGVFFFNNSGSISAYNTTTGIWETGTASSASASFRSLQDDSVPGFDDTDNTLLAASDDDRIVYLSYDYSTSAFLKYNGANNTFDTAGIRPSGEQFLMGIY
ncbi:MAG: hypothetical protein ACW99G_00575 [Candidatus Thorarchaeota archaeon]|jgi:PKD repeat protein